MSSTQHDDKDDPWWAAAIAIAVCALALVAILAIPFYLWPIYSRYQARQDRNQHRSQALKDAHNDVLVNTIRIGYYHQELGIAKQQADIRLAKAVGIRKAQNEIAKTLTPLYVQEDEIDALKAIALSGRNATVIYVPVGSDGKPIVDQTAPVDSAHTTTTGK